MKINMREIHELLELSANAKHDEVMQAIETQLFTNPEYCSYLKGVRAGLWEAMKIIRFIEMNQEGE